MKDAVPEGLVDPRIPIARSVVPLGSRAPLLFGSIIIAILADHALRFAIETWVSPPQDQDEVAWVFYAARINAISAVSEVPLFMTFLLFAFVFWAKFRRIAVLMAALACIPTAGIARGASLVAQAPALLRSTPVRLPWSSLRDYQARPLQDAASWTCLGAGAVLVVVAMLMRRENAA